MARIAATANTAEIEMGGQIKAVLQSSFVVHW
jgi:hypothetical protein